MTQKWMSLSDCLCGCIQNTAINICCVDQKDYYVGYAIALFSMETWNQNNLLASLHIEPRHLVTVKKSFESCVLRVQSKFLEVIKPMFWMHAYMGEWPISTTTYQNQIEKKRQQQQCSICIFFAGTEMRKYAVFNLNFSFLYKCHWNNEMRWTSLQNTSMMKKFNQTYVHLPFCLVHGEICSVFEKCFF